MENIINKVTLGSQGENIYDINKKIIDLSEPLLTKEAKDDMDSLIHAPLDPSGREIKNVYNIFKPFLCSFNLLLLLTRK